MTAAFAGRRQAWIVGTLLFLSYAYFYQAGGWNQNSRFALVRALVEQHTVRIDAYEQATGDKARWRGHYYSDKAPGSALLALAPVAAAGWAAKIAGVDPASRAGVAWTSYVATVFTSGLFTTIAALSMMWVLIRWGWSSRAAAFAATAYGLATPAWAYATLFMGHAQAAGCLMLAFAAAIALDGATARNVSRLAWLLGIAGGWAVVTEFPAAVPLAFIVTLALVTRYHANSTTIARSAWPIFVGGALTALVLMAYNAIAFRSPFHLGYASEQGFEALHTGLFGITYPTWDRLRGILVSAYRGILPIAPLMALAPIGVVRLVRVPASRRGAVAAAAIVVFYIALNASYFYWEGGWAYGPRHITPALPFLALGLAPLWDRWRAVGRVALASAWLWGAALTLIAVSTTPQPPGDVASPVSELLWPAFVEGDLALNNQGFVDARADEGRLRHHPELHAAWNLGEFAGLHGCASLIPLAIVWTMAGVAFVTTLTGGRSLGPATRRGRSPM